MRDWCRHLRISYNPRGCCMPTRAPAYTCAWACCSWPTTAPGYTSTWACCSKHTTAPGCTCAWACCSRPTTAPSCACAWACNSTLTTGPCTYRCCACAWACSSCWFSLMLIMQDHHQGQPHHVGHAGYGCELGCLREASPIALNGFESETEKEPVQSYLRQLCIN